MKKDVRDTWFKKSAYKFCLSWFCHASYWTTVNEKKVVNEKKAHLIAKALDTQEGRMMLASSMSLAIAGKPSNFNLLASLEKIPEDKYEYSKEW